MSLKTCSRNDQKYDAFQKILSYSIKREFNTILLMLIEINSKWQTRETRDTSKTVLINVVNHPVYLIK